MKIKSLIKQLSALVVGVVILGLNSFSALAVDPSAVKNPTTQTIPISVEVPSYYIVSAPANLDGSGNLRLTQQYNAFLTSDDDTVNTFYGYSTVGVSGSIASDKAVFVSQTVADLQKTGDTSTTAVMNMMNLTAERKAKVDTIWSSSSSIADKAAAAIGFGTETWAVGTTGTSTKYLSTEFTPTTAETKYTMLRTTLPINGTYTSNLVITFSLGDATGG